MKRAHFKFNFDWIQSKLADWKMRLLNKAGRVTLWFLGRSAIILKDWFETFFGADRMEVMVFI